MGEHDRTWATWLAGVLLSFAVLEGRALASREPGKPSGTLTSVCRRWLGTDPRARRRWVCGGLFSAACVWLAGHMCSTKVGPN